MIHENIQKIRSSKGVTKTHVAKKLGLSLQGYRYIENGDSKLDVERLKEIAVILDVDINIFFDDELTESVIYRKQTIV